jgi:hypothetical protein
VSWGNGSRKELRMMKDPTPAGAQFEISIDGVLRTYRDRKDIALESAKFLKSRNPNSVVKLKDLQTGEEIVVAFSARTN